VPADSSSANEARKLILGFERACDPFRHLVRSASIWTALRFPAAEQLRISLGDLTQRSVPAVAAGRVSALGTMLRERRQLDALIRGRRRSRIVALTTTNRLRDETLAGYRNAYYDYFVPELPDALHVYLDSAGARSPSHADSVNLSSRALWPELARGRFGRADGKDEVEALRRDLFGYLENEGYGGVLHERTRTWERDVSVFAARFDSFVGVFKGVRPAVVMSDCYYDRTWAVAAARSLRIPVWELQHGVVYDGHMAYTFDPVSADAHRDTLPVPDLIMTFGPFFRGVLLERGFWRPEEICNLGFPRLSWNAERFQWAPPAPGDPLRVLVSSQWILTDRWTGLLRKLAAALPAVRLVVKPHPGEAQDAWSDVPGVEVASPGGDFFETLRSCHVHCSVFSTTLLESVGLGVPTAVVGLPGSEVVRFLADSGAARLAQDGDALVGMLENVNANPQALVRWHADTVAARSRYWSDDSGGVMQRLLKESGNA